MRQPPPQPLSPPPPAGSRRAGLLSTPLPPGGSRRTELLVAPPWPSPVPPPGGGRCRFAVRGSSPLRRFASRLAAAVTAASLGTGTALAGTGGSDLPWNHPLQVVVDNLTGPTAKTIAALAFVLGGAMWAFTSHEQGARRFGQALFGVAVVLGSVNLVETLGFQGGLL
jgi:type IV secretory pathway VirB2 component (pilin)